MAKSPAVTKNYTPQQVEFAMRYFLPTSDTFSNALQSALRAGYSQEYSETITTKDLDWIDSIMSDIVGKDTDKKNLVTKAKKVLAKSLDAKDMRLAQDTAKFIAKTDIEFSEKHDVTTGGEKIDSPYNKLSLDELKKLAGK